jgi:hypothetical protein
MSDDKIIHFNPWRDFNDAAPLDDPFAVEPDAGQIARFIDVVFGYSERLIPVRSFVDKGQGKDGRPHNIWIEADTTAPEKLATFPGWANREGAAVYVIPGTVAEQGQARAADVVQMQSMVVDLDSGDIPAKLDHLVHHLGRPTLIVESGGRTPDGATKLHVWWKLTEPAEGADLARLCQLRGVIALKVGGDMHFRSAHQPIRVPGTVYHNGGQERLGDVLQRQTILSPDPQKQVANKRSWWNIEVARRRSLANAARAVIVRPVARAEPAAPLADRSAALAKRHAAQMGADADNH